MECSSLASAVPASAGVDGATPACDPAASAQFKEAVNRPEASDVYIDGQHTANPGNPLVGVIDAFDSLKLTPAGGPRADSIERDPAYETEWDANREEAQAEADGFSEFGDTLLAVQSQILRTTLMMETMNTAKQGMTTLFQQQG